MIISKCFCDRCGKQFKYKWERYMAEFTGPNESDPSYNFDLCEECYETAKAILSTGREEKLRQERIEEMNQEDQNE